MDRRLMNEVPRMWFRMLSSFFRLWMWCSINGYASNVEKCINVKASRKSDCARGEGENRK